MTFVRGIRLDTAGNRRFSGARQMPGADVWLASEPSRGLDPDGWMVRRPHGRHHTQENREASAATSRGVWQAGRHGTKLSKVGYGEVLPLDRSILMGEFPIRIPPRMFTVDPNTVIRTLKVHDRLRQRTSFSGLTYQNAPLEQRPHRS
jgi:hypothetical protein